MEKREVLEYLEDLAETLGVEIVYEKLGQDDFQARGGLCKIKGTYKIFVDRSESIEAQIEILAKALSSFDTESIYILPHIRGILEKTGKSWQSGEPLPVISHQKGVSSKSQRRIRQKYENAK